MKKSRQLRIKRILKLDWRDKRRAKLQSADALADSEPATFSGHGGSIFTNTHKNTKGKMLSAIATSSPSLVIRPIL